MIPKTIHYCWFGRNEMPKLALDCISSWHKYMPDWEYKLWNDDNFDVNSTPYTAEAYIAGKYAFVSDHVRLWALEHEGGLYLDTDVEVLRPFDPLLYNTAFVGFEGSKHKPIGTCVMASEPHSQWIQEMLGVYKELHFIKPDGTLDLTTNVQRLTAVMAANGLRQDGKEQDYKDLHVFPVDYFCPRLTTGEYCRTSNTYCEHKGLNSWQEVGTGWKGVIRGIVGQHNMTRLIKFKRKFEKQHPNH